jgi:hypothetical protein
MFEMEVADPIETRQKPLPRFSVPLLLRPQLLQRDVVESSEQAPGVGRTGHDRFELPVFDLLRRLARHRPVFALCIKINRNGTHRQILSNFIT